MSYISKTTTARALLATAGLSLLIAAPASAHTTTKAKIKSIDITFAAVAGDKPVACAVPVAGLGMSAKTAQLKDLRFYVSGVELLRADGRAVPLDLGKDSAFRLTRKGAAVTLIDLENGKGACADEGTKATNAHVRGTVPAGKYIGVRWTVGVPSSLNHTDLAAAPAPLNLAAMGWSWQVGRKFLKVDLADPAFMVHIGSTGCTGNPATGAKVKCTSANRPVVRLKAFDPARQKVAVDVQALLSGATFGGGMSMDMGGMATAAADMPMDMSGCMSGPGEQACGSVFGALGLAWNATSGGGAASASKQKVFRAIGR